MAGNLDAIRDQSRALVHARFALPAIIRSAEGTAIGEARARLHQADSRPFADLDREGFAFSIEGKNMLVFDQTEWDPQTGHIVDFGRGRVYQIEHIVDEKNRTRYQRCVATEVLQS